MKALTVLLASSVIPMLVVAHALLNTARNLGGVV